MPIDIHIIASCTDRKRAPVSPELCLRNIHGADAEARAKHWWDQLRTHDCLTVRAQDLYAGDHWSVVKELPALALQVCLHPHLWITSAGYGLIQSSTAIRPYSATFSRGHADSVSTGLLSSNGGVATVNRQWWRALSEKNLTNSSEPRSISQLAKRNPHARIFVVAFSAYVTALEDDLRQAVAILHRPEQLVIISAPSLLANADLAPNWIPSSARLQAQMGGPRLSLHARVARDILRRSQSKNSDEFLDAPRLREHYEQLIQRSAVPTRYERTPMADNEVQQFIDKTLQKESLSWSAALRQLRDSGRACEQQRFKRLFIEIRNRK